MIIPNKRQLIVVDLDDTLVSFNEELRIWHNREYGSTIISLKEVTDFRLSTVWNCPLEEARRRITEFYKDPLFLSGKPFPGAYETLGEISSDNRVIIATARPEQFTREVTQEQVAGFGSLIERVYYAEDLPNKNKGLLALELKANLAIDDAQHNIQNYVEAGVPAILFNYNNSFGWNDLASAPEGAMTSTSWEENYRHCTELMRKSA